jgi:hypothetical protein
MRLPDVIGIGFRRCATSWLHSCLNEHPDVGKTPRGIHYFSYHYDKGNDWYSGQLAAFADKKVILDFSISYTFPEHIHQFVEHMPPLLPRAKIFAVVRDPVERAFSDYRRSVFKEEFASGTTFEEALIKAPILLERGRYGTILQTLCSAVPQDSIQIFFYDDIESNPDEFWKDMCEFLGVSPKFTPGVLYTRLHHLAQPKHPRVHSFLRKINRRVTHMAQVVGLGQIFLSLKGTSSWRKLVDKSVGEVGEIQLATRKKLMAYYADDIAFLSSFTGRDLFEWLELNEED